MVNKGIFMIVLIVIFVSYANSICIGETIASKPSAIIITSQKLTSDSKAKIAIFEGDVHAKRGDVNLYANIMRIYYKTEGQETSNKIYKIEAQGNVKMIKGKQILTSDSATYNSEPVETLVFTGQPRGSDGENVIIGTKMTYYIAEDKTVVEDSKVMIVEKSTFMKQ